MFKDFLLARVKPGVSREALRATVAAHAVVSLSVAALAEQMRRYTDNDVCEGVGDLTVFDGMPGLTVIVEHVMGGEEGIRKFEGDQQYLRLVRPHEKFISDYLTDGAPEMVAITEERPVFTSTDPVVYRAFDFVRRPASMPQKRFRDELSADGRWAEADGAYRSAVARRVHSLAGQGGASFAPGADPFDAVIETWIAAPERMADTLDEQRRRRGAFCDPDRSFSAITREKWIHGSTDAFGPCTND